MARYNPKERIGVQKFALLVDEHSDWIFREQTIADVGVDGIVEQTINGDPNGAMIACQIKSGNSYFYIRKKDGKLVFGSITNVHRKYWIDYDIPVILILVDDNGTIYWELLNQNTIKKKKTLFKIEIPKSQKLLPENINEVFEMISHSKNPRNLVFEGMEAEDNESFFDNVLSIQIAGNAGINMGRAFEDYFKHIESIINRLNYFKDKGVRENRKIINNQIGKIATQNNLLGQLVESNTKVMAEGYAISLRSIEKYFSKIEPNKLTKENHLRVQNSISELHSNTNSVLKKIDISDKEIDSTLTFLLEQIHLYNKEIGEGLEAKNPFKYKELRKSKIYLSNILTILKKELNNVNVHAAKILDILNDITLK